MFIEAISVKSNDILQYVKDMVDNCYETIVIENNSDNSITVKLGFPQKYNDIELKRISDRLKYHEEKIEKLFYVRSCSCYMVTDQKMELYISFHSKINLLN